MNAYVICRDQFTWTDDVCKHIVRFGMTPIIVDKQSTNSEFINWRNKCGYEFFVLRNGPPHTIFRSRLVKKETEPYVVTDPDLDLSEVPDDAKSVLTAALDKYKPYEKVGFSLRIDDLPNTELSDQVKKWESRFWHTRIDNHYAAQIDTTFALYRPKFDDCKFYPAVRLAEPYCVRHLPWYITDKTVPPDDYTYYCRNANIKATYWTSKMEKDASLVKERS